jgi:hypothetical protein
VVLQHVGFVGYITQIVTVISSAAIQNGAWSGAQAFSSGMQLQSTPSISHIDATDVQYIFASTREKMIFVRKNGYTVLKQT